MFLSAVALAAPAGAQEKRGGDRYKITQADIAEAGSGIMTARDVIRTLRPQWMTPPPLGGKRRPTS